MKRYTHSTLLTFAVLIAGGFALSACNTVDGAGQDIEQAGEAVQDAAN